MKSIKGRRPTPANLDFLPIMSVDDENSDGEPPPRKGHRGRDNPMRLSVVSVKQVAEVPDKERSMFRPSTPGAPPVNSSTLPAVNESSPTTRPPSALKRGDSLLAPKRKSSHQRGVSWGTVTTVETEVVESHEQAKKEREHELPDLS